MRRSAIAAVIIAFVSVSMGFSGDAAANWIPRELRALAPPAAVTAIAAAVLARYFEWRARLFSDIRAGHDVENGDRPATPGPGSDGPPIPPMAA